MSSPRDAEINALRARIGKLEADYDAPPPFYSGSTLPAADKGEYKNFALYFDVLKKLGMQTPYEQYTLYATVGAFLYGSYSPIRKAFFLEKWLHETDPSLKDIWLARANLSLVEEKGGMRYVQELKKVPKRYAILPLSFLLIEGIRSGYRQLSSVFSCKQ
jgi:hypothetical protein